jgi:hypothetical protein
MDTWMQLNDQEFSDMQHASPTSILLFYHANTELTLDFGDE